jgi:hypothetical protein
LFDDASPRVSCLPATEIAETFPQSTEQAAGQLDGHTMTTVSIEMTSTVAQNGTAMPEIQYSGPSFDHPFLAPKNVTDMTIGDIVLDDTIALNPVFDFNAFTGYTLVQYFALIPSLRLCTIILASPRAVRFLHTIFFNALHTDANGQLTLVDDVKGPLSPAQETLVSMAMQSLAEVLKIRCMHPRRPTRRRPTLLHTPSNHSLQVLPRPRLHYRVPDVSAGDFGRRNASRPRHNKPQHALPLQHIRARRDHPPRTRTRYVGTS